MAHRSQGTQHCLDLGYWSCAWQKGLTQKKCEFWSQRLRVSIPALPPRYVTSGRGLPPLSLFPYI